MKLVITRPRTDAVPLAAKLQARGHHCIILPLLDIVPRNDVTVPQKPWQAICITSANGLVNAAPVQHLRTTAVYCVGPQSATAAASKGFVDVRPQGGDVAGLSRYIIQNLKPANGPLLYLSGAATSGDLEGILTKAGFDVTRLVTYDAIETTSPDMAQALQSAEGVLLYSPRSAMIWVEQVEKSVNRVHITNVIHYCLSPAVAAKLPPRWQKCVAQTSDEGAMFALLNRT